MGNAVEELGFGHILAFDHVVGANTASRPGWDKPYDLTSQFHDPFVLFSFLSAVTTELGFVTGILILPQRQTVLVAKQAACLDVLCGGRFRLGIGTGWNELEYEALGVPFEVRGDLIEEQVAVLRGLWSEDAFTFSGDYHSIPDVGLCPMPVQRPVPLWFGGGSDRPAFGNQPAREKVLRRIARLADGWIPQFDAPRPANAPSNCWNDSGISVASTDETRTQSVSRSGCTYVLVPRRIGRRRSQGGVHSVQRI